MTIQSNEWLDVVEKLRAERYPDLPASLVRDVLSVQEKYVDSPGDALRNIRSIITAHLEEGTGE